MKNTSAGASTWQGVAANWLASTLEKEAKEGIQKVWTIETVELEANSALGISKSRRSWERFLASLEFLEVRIDEERISYSSDIKANTLVIGQIVKRARSSRKPIFFLASHPIAEINVVTACTTKGSKRWIALPKRIDDPREYLSQLTVLLTASSIVIPNGHAVSVLREIRIGLGDDARVVSPDTDWFSGLLAFQEPLQGNQRLRKARGPNSSDERPIE